MRNIAPELWERVYHESLVLLENFPARLTRLEVQESRGEKRYLYTPEIVCRRDAPAEHWRVVGDLSSRQEAEDFELYRHHKRQFPDGRFVGDPGDSYDVLWSEPDDEVGALHGEPSELWAAAERRMMQFAISRRRATSRGSSRAARSSG